MQDKNFADPVYYQIIIEGVLDSKWSEWFHGMTLTPQEDGICVLEGMIPDQAGLHGILALIRDLGMPIIALKRKDINR